MALVTGLSPEQEALTAMLWLLYTIMAVLVLVSIPGYLREVVWGFQVAALLQQRQVCLLVRSGFPEAELKPRGRSFSVSLAFGILLALYDEKCVLGNPSWLWGRCLETIAAKSSSYAFTGDLSSTGQIGRVARSADKVEATRKHPMITDFFMPNQDRDLGTEIHQLSGSPQVLRLRRHGNLAKLLLDAGGSFRLAGIIQNLVATLSAVALLTAWPDVHKMLLPPPPPQLVFWKCDWVDYQNSQHSYLVAFRDQPARTFPRPPGPGSSQWARQCRYGI
jgi:hypothetical protein